MDLRTKNVEEVKQLELAYRTVAIILRNSFCSADVPKRCNPEEIPARQLQLKLESLDGEIRFLRNVLDGKIKPAFKIIEGDLMHTPSHDKLEAKERQHDKETMEQGINILKSWRRAYMKRLALVKLKQPMLRLNQKKVADIVQEANEMIASIDVFIGQKLQILRELTIKHGKLSAEHEAFNLDPNLTLQPFPVLPRHIKDAKLFFKVDF